MYKCHTSRNNEKKQKQRQHQQQSELFKALNNATMDIYWCTLSNDTNHTVNIVECKKNASINWS